MTLEWKFDHLWCEGLKVGYVLKWGGDWFCRMVPDGRLTRAPSEVEARRLLEAEVGAR